MKFYTLIHICKDEKSIHNNSFVTSFDKQIDRYFKCAKQLHLSLQNVRIPLVLLTNDKAFLERLNTDKYAIDIVELNFSLKVPSGLNFYSAHFKLEVFNYLSSLKEEYLGLVDCDILCINRISTSFQTCIDNRVSLYYDITDQMTPAFGEDNIIRDKEKLSNKKSVGLWAGGEFLAGAPSFFAKIYKEIEGFKDIYFTNYNTFVHQGDEMLTSVAIENLILEGLNGIFDAGSLSIIARFWSPKPLHVQKPLNAYSSHFLLHLPSDKQFINGLKKEDLMGDSFFNNYKYHLLKSRFLQHAFQGIKPLIKKGSEKLAEIKKSD